MTTKSPTGRVPEARRKEAFLALVAAQDRGASVPDSRREVTELYDLTDDEIRSIEREGVDKAWPPL